MGVRAAAILAGLVWDLYNMLKSHCLISFHSQEARAYTDFRTDMGC